MKPIYQHTFVFDEDWYDALKSLEPKMRLAAYDALCDFAFNRNLPDDKVIRAIITPMCNQLRRSWLRWLDSIGELGNVAKGF